MYAWFTADVPDGAVRSDAFAGLDDEIADGQQNRRVCGDRQDDRIPLAVRAHHELVARVGSGMAVNDAAAIALSTATTYDALPEPVPARPSRTRARRRRPGPLSQPTGS